METVLDNLSRGYLTPTISSNPINDGVFEGYYEVTIPLIDNSGVKPEIVKRIVYATYEQVAQGRMILPEEGLFCLDPED